MSNTPNIDYLLQQATALKALLDDPYPGLVTWHAMLQERLRAIADFYNGTETKTTSETP